MRQKIFFLISSLFLLPFCNENSTTGPTDVIQNKNIAFISTRDGNPELYSMLSDGSQQKRLTHSSGYERDPNWSPNKAKLAYYLMSNGVEGIFIFDLNTSDSTKLTDSYSLYGNINWNNSGSFICFDTHQHFLHCIIGLINVSTGSTFYITPDSIFQEYSPCWTFDNSRLVFISQDSILSNTNKLVSCKSNGLDKLILYTSSTLVYYPSCSPKSNKIAFYEKLGNGQKSSIRLLDLDDHSLQTIYDSAYVHPNLSNVYRLAWSPDGSKIAFISGGETVEDICIIGIDGSNFINLTNDSYSDTSPDWSFDSKELIFVSNRTGSKQIFSIGIENQIVSQLTFSSGDNYSPNW